MLSPVSISFSTYSTREILDMSCVEVTIPAAFDTLGYPIPNGLYDEKMGPLKMDGICRTCGLGYFECPGHFGHIKLPGIVISPMHFDFIYKQVASTCEKCFQNAKNRCKRCSFKMPKFSRSQGKIFRDDELFEPNRIIELLKNIGRRVDGYFLEVIPVVPNKFRPVNYYEGKVFEDSQNIILAKIVKSVMAANDVLQKAKEKYEGTFDRNEVEKNGQVQSSGVYNTKEVKGWKKSAPDSVDGIENTQDVFECYLNSLKEFEELVYSIEAYYDSSNLKYVRGKAPNGIKQLLEKKEGLFRKHIMGKRVNYAARSVISPDPNIETREIGIPLIFAKKLTFPEPVTYFNHDKLRCAVMNGSKYPGATFLKSNGVVTNLSKISEEKRIALANQLLIGKKVVYRHLNNKDFLLVNRQPTLHKPSIMAYKVRVLKGEKTIRLHYANCNSHNADFDGDEMNIHAMQCYLSKSEAKYLALNDYNYKVSTSGNPIRGLVQDHIVMSSVLTMKDYFLKPSDYENLLFIPLLDAKVMLNENRKFTHAEPMHTDRKFSCERQKGIEERWKLDLKAQNYASVLYRDLPDRHFGNKGSKKAKPAILRPAKLYTGKQVVTSLLLSLGLTVSIRKPSKLEIRGHSEENEVLVRKGVMLTGVLDKNNLGPTDKGLVHLCGEIFGEALYNDVLTAIAQVINRMLVVDGYTLRMEDLLLSSEGELKRKEAIDKGRNRVDEVLMQYLCEKDTNFDEKTLKDSLFGDQRCRKERDKLATGYWLDKGKIEHLDCIVKNETNTITSEVGNLSIINSLLKKFPYNNMELIILTGAKGSMVNLSQISGLLGQQELEGKRVPLMVDGRSLPVLSQATAESGGFIFERFLSGVKTHSYYFHCMAGREGLIDTAVKTSRSGYLQRCLIKHLEGVKVEYDGTVRNNGCVISFLYGEDGLNCTKSGMLGNRDFLTDNYEELLGMYLKENAHVSNNTPLLNSERYISCDYADRGAARMDEALRLIKDWRTSLAKVQPGDPVGVIAGQSLGEPSTQMTLNTFHLAGVGSKNMTLGIPRLIEILMVASKRIKTPYLSVPAVDLSHFFKKISLPDCLKRLIVREKMVYKEHEVYKKLVIEFEIKYEHELVKREVSEQFVHLLNKRIKKASKGPQVIIKTKNHDSHRHLSSTETASQGVDERPGNTSEKDSTSVTTYIALTNNASIGDRDSLGNDLDEPCHKKLKREDLSTSYDPEKNVLKVETFLRVGLDLIIYPLIEKTVSEMTLKEVSGVERANWSDGILTLEGANMSIINLLTKADVYKAYSNDINSVKDYLGIEAARCTIIRETGSVFDAYGINVNFRHFSLIGDYMTRTGDILPFSRNGFIERDSILQKMSFESCYSLLRLATQREKSDPVSNPSACQALGIPVKLGTGAFTVMYDFE